MSVRSNWPRDDAAEVLTDEFRVFLDRLGEGAEDHAGLGQLLLERRRYRHAVENGVDRDAGKARALVQRNTELVVGLKQFRVDLVEAFRPVLVGFRRRIVGNRVEVDGRVVHVGPAGFLHLPPQAVGAQPPLEHELGLILDGRDRPDDVFVQAGWQPLAFDVGDEAVLVAPVDEDVQVFAFGSHEFSFFPLR